MGYLNMIPTAAWSDDHAEAGQVPFEGQSVHTGSCMDLLAAVASGTSVIASALPKSQWQVSDTHPPL
jgi:hypothetical protein